MVTTPKLHSPLVPSPGCPECARLRQRMVQLEGLSFVEIGRRLDLSANTVRKHFVRAMTHCLLLIED